MHFSQRSLINGLVLLGCGAFLAVGCGDDSGEGDAPNGGTSSAGTGKGGKPGGAGTSSGGKNKGGSGGTDATSEAGMPAGGSLGVAGDGMSSAGEQGMAGAGTGGAVSFLVPAGGGEVEVMTASGNVVSFDFPASAAGVTVTLTPDSSASIGWNDGRFVDVIRMEPDGTTFAQPVEIRTANQDLLLFDYATSPSKGKAEGLALNGSGNALLLNHFSTLVVVPPEYSCDSQSGWVATPNSGQCAAFGADSTAIDFTCKAYSYCLLITAHCCAAPGSSECELGMQGLTLTYQPRDSNGGQYPYCDAPPVGGEGGAGGMGNDPDPGGSAGTASGDGGAAGSGTGTLVETVIDNTQEVTTLRPDGATLYFNTGGSIKSVPVAGGNATPIAASADFFGAFDLDATNVYFSSGGGMYAHAKSGAGNDVDLALTGAFFSNAYVEESGGSLYIASGIKIFKAPVTGNTAAATLVASEPGPSSLVVSGTDLFFVTATGTGTHQKAVMKVPTAGGAATALIENLADNPRALAISGGYVYYIVGAAISRIPLAGGAAEPVASSGGSYLAVDGSDVYFVSDDTFSHVGTTGQVVTPLATSLINARVAVDASHAYYSTMGATAPGIFRIAR